MTCSQRHGRNLLKIKQKKCLWGAKWANGESKGCHQVSKLPIAGFAVCWLISLSWGLLLISVSHCQVLFVCFLTWLPWCWHGSSSECSGADVLCNASEEK